MEVLEGVRVKNPKFGDDIEFFLKSKDNGEIVSAEGIIRGTKTDPYHFDDKNKFFATSLDNILAEGNIPPSTDPLEFYNNVNKLIQYINSIVPKELTTAALPSARLDVKYLQTDNAMIFGCDPSLNCWTLQEVRPQPSGDNLRSAGTHIHIGYDNINDDTNVLLARACDLYLGVPAVLKEPANERKQVGYGLAGNFRHQKHGVEYRSLSSHFSSSKDLIEWCFNNANEAIKFVNSGRSEEISSLGDMLQEIINTEDKVTAQFIIEQFNIPM